MKKANKAPAVREIERVLIEAIDVPSGRRPLNGTNLDRLSESLAEIGLQTPITIRYFANRASLDGMTDDSFVLISGHHRLAAAKALGWEKIECFVLYDEAFSEVDDQMIEIAENLHRAELSVLERDKQILKWMELRKSRDSRKANEEVSVQVAPKPQGGRPEGGISAAARGLGIEETDAKRAVRVASLSDEAQDAARALHLDNNRSALLEAARQPEPERQVAALNARAARRRAADVETPQADVTYSSCLPPRPAITPRMREQATAEVGLLIATHFHPTEMIDALLKNLSICGNREEIIAAIKTAQAKKR